MQVFFVPLASSRRFFVEQHFGILRRFLSCISQELNSYRRLPFAKGVRCSSVLTSTYFCICYLRHPPDTVRSLRSRSPVAPHISNMSYFHLYTYTYCFRQRPRFCRIPQYRPHPNSSIFLVVAVCSFFDLWWPIPGCWRHALLAELIRDLTSSSSFPSLVIIDFRYLNVWTSSSWGPFIETFTYRLVWLSPCNLLVFRRVFLRQPLYPCLQQRWRHRGNPYLIVGVVISLFPRHLFWKNIFGKRGILQFLLRTDWKVGVIMDIRAVRLVL